MKVYFDIEVEYSEGWEGLKDAQKYVFENLRKFIIQRLKPLEQKYWKRRKAGRQS